MFEVFLWVVCLSRLTSSNFILNHGTGFYKPAVPQYPPFHLQDSRWLFKFFVIVLLRVSLTRYQDFYTKYFGKNFPSFLFYALFIVRLFVWFYSNIVDFFEWIVSLYEKVITVVTEFRLKYSLNLSHRKSFFFQSLLVRMHEGFCLPKILQERLLVPGTRWRSIIYRSRDVIDDSA